LRENVIYTDGSCIPNPGFGGWANVGSVNGEYFEKGHCAYKQTTNNEMELYAMYKALSYCYTYHYTKTFQVFSDSYYVVSGIANLHKYHRNGWKLSNDKPIANKQLFVKIYRLITYDPEWFKQITITHVKGHSGVPYNERADVLATTYARRAKDEQRQKQPA